MPVGITFDIIRDTHKDANWLNRFVRDPKTNNILYYCETTPDSKLHIRRGGKHGPTVAEVNACLVTPGVTDVHFTDPLYTVELQHIEDDTHHSKTRFSPNGNVFYDWNGHASLVKVDDGEVVAEFFPSWRVHDVVEEHKIGTLTVKGQGEDMLDVVIATALTVQERSEEGRKAAEEAHMRAMERGIDKV